MQPTRESNTRSIGKPFDRGTAWRFSAAEVIWLSCAGLPADAVSPGIFGNPGSAPCICRGNRL